MEPSGRARSSSSTAGERESSSVLSPSSALPRCLIPSIAARSAATTSSPLGSELSPSDEPARRNAVPQIGPEVPPIRLVRMIAVFFSSVPTSLRSISSQSEMTISKPRASE